MKDVLAITAISAGMALSAAQAATIDFENNADTVGERGFQGAITVDGVNLNITANIDNGGDLQNSIYPYLDAGEAGLGACQAINAALQCVPSADDSVSAGETISIEFLSENFNGATVRDITNLRFRDGEHNLITGEATGLIRIQNFKGGDLTDTFSAFIALAAAGDSFFTNISGLRLSYIDTDFYLSALEVSESVSALTTPIPGALPLLLSGIAGLGFASRNRRKPV